MFLFELLTVDIFTAQDDSHDIFGIDWALVTENNDFSLLYAIFK